MVIGQQEPAGAEADVLGLHQRLRDQQIRRRMRLPRRGVMFADPGFLIAEFVEPAQDLRGPNRAPPSARAPADATAWRNIRVPWRSPQCCSLHDASRSAAASAAARGVPAPRRSRNRSIRRRVPRADPTRLHHEQISERGRMPFHNVLRRRDDGLSVGEKDISAGRKRRLRRSIPARAPSSRQCRASRRHQRGRRAETSETPPSSRRGMRPRCQCPQMPYSNRMKLERSSAP